MAIWNFLVFGRKKDREGIGVQRIKKQKPPELGEMAAGNLRGASNTISQILDLQDMPTKILVVQDGGQFHNPRGLCSENGTQA